MAPFIDCYPNHLRYVHFHLVEKQNIVVMSMCRLILCVIRNTQYRSFLGAVFPVSM